MLNSKPPKLLHVVELNHCPLTSFGSRQQPQVTGTSLGVTGRSRGVVPAARWAMLGFTSTSPRLWVEPVLKMLTASIALEHAPIPRHLRKSRELIKYSKAFTPRQNIVAIA